MPAQTIPDIWPYPNNPATRARVHAIQVNRPLVGDPVVSFFFSEAVEAGTSSFDRGAPDLSQEISLSAMMADPDLAEFAIGAMHNMEQIAYVLYLRKKAALEPSGG